MHAFFLADMQASHIEASDGKDEYSTIANQAIDSSEVTLRISETSDQEYAEFPSYVYCMIWRNSKTQNMRKSMAFTHKFDINMT